MPRPPLWVPDEEGSQIAVLDLTHPAFRITVDDSQLARLADSFVRDAVHAPPLSPAARTALERSRLGRALLAASGTYLSGMGTYRLKLGPEALGPEADPVDRRLAVSFPAVCLRIRLQDIVRLIVDGIQDRLGVDEHRPLSLINIGGGPAADSFNTLLVLETRSPALLSSRRIEISVADVDDAGPAFGGRVIDALRQSDQPLRDLLLSFSTIHYNWCGPQVERLLRGLVDQRAMTVVSSEGALFEYGDDEPIVVTLRSLYATTAGDALVVGSVTRSGPPLDALRGPSRAMLRPRSIDAFGRLAMGAGWQLDEVVERPLCYAVRMTKAKS